MDCLETIEEIDEENKEYSWILERGFSLHSLLDDMMSM